MNRSFIRKSVAGVGALALVTAGFLATAPTASAAEVVQPVRGTEGDTGYYLTLVARACQPVGTDPLDSLKNIYANQDRDDIQQTLYQLGGDSQYSGSNDQVRPEKEDAGTQASPNCAPAVGQTFSLGINGSGPKVSNLSTVSTSASVNRVVTTGTTDTDYTEAGVANGTIAGAVTIQLTQAEFDRADDASLWVQGGTTAEPLAAGRLFAALRCGNDYLKGDNVEWVAFNNAGQKHAYCYYFTVAEPEDAGSGTITIKKQIEGSGDVPGDPDFTIHGVTYNANETFELKAGDEKSFLRGVGEWTVSEDEADIPEGFDFAKVECKDTSGTDVGSGDIVNGTKFTLAKDQTVTCTFTNSYGPVPTCTENCNTTPPPSCTSNCGGGSTPPSTPETPKSPDPVPTTPAPVATVEAAQAVGLPAPAAAAPEAVTVPEAATVPEMGTVPDSVPAGGGSSAPNGIPGWALLLIALGALGAVTAAAKTVGSRR